MQPVPSRRQRRRRSVLDATLQEVPWHWQALALLVFCIVAVFVIEESDVSHRDSRAGTNNELVDINFGTQRELESLPGIGPVLAKAIIAARPYSSANELARVRGIGPKLAAQLLPHIQAARGRRSADQR
jgi:DNA uptake protein ComE-like DNA-binding protein